MSTLLTRILRNPANCALCQLGQGRACACEEAQRRTLPVRKVGFRWPRLSPTEWLWLLIAFDIACLVGAGMLIAHLMRSWSGA